MLRWLKTAAVKPGLPDPQKANTPEKKKLIENVNEIVEKEILPVVYLAQVVAENVNVVITNDFYLKLKLK